MKALVLLSHGSRLPGSNREMIALADNLSALEDNPFAAVCCAFQQFARPSFPEVIDDLVRRDMRQIVVLPLFLASGSHVRVDLPEMIKAAATQYPDLRVTVAAHLGKTEGLAGFLLDSVRQYLSAD